MGGIPYYSTEDDIRSFFESCGTVTEVDCMKFPESGKFRGIAILTFKVILVICLNSLLYTAMIRLSFISISYVSPLHMLVVYLFYIREAFSILPSKQLVSWIYD